MWEDVLDDLRMSVSSPEINFRCPPLSLLSALTFFETGSLAKHGLCGFRLVFQQAGLSVSTSPALGTGMCCYGFLCGA